MGTSTETVRTSPTGGVAVLGEDNPDTRMICARLGQRGYRAVLVRRATEAIEACEPGHAELLLILLPTHAPSEVMKSVRAADPTLKIIVAGGGEELDAGQMMSLGAFECVEDPLQNSHRLLAAVGLALGARQEDRELDYLRQRDANRVRLEQLVGKDRSMDKVLHFVKQVCLRTSTGGSPTILIMGETGTGKGALAKCIHYRSVRRNRPLVEINCAALPANLVESELFGYEKGAFTDARRARAGLFETADGGTLFLDEVRSLPLDLQAKLLTVIEDKRIRRVGGRSSITVDVQLIAASQPVIKTMVKQGTFRDDLYHRLNVLSVKLPPLRDRGDDRVRLADRFIADICRDYGTEERELAPSAIEFITRYYWPGNVRELRNQIERIVLLSNERVIEGWQFERASGEFLRLDAGTPSQGLQVRLPTGGISLKALEKTVIEMAMVRHDGNVSKTARYLGISRQTLMYRIKKHGIQSS